MSRMWPPRPAPAPPPRPPPVPYPSPGLPDPGPDPGLPVLCTPPEPEPDDPGRVLGQLVVAGGAARGAGAGAEAGWALGTGGRLLLLATEAQENAGLGASCSPAAAGCEEAGWSAAATGSGVPWPSSGMLTPTAAPPAPPAPPGCEDGCVGPGWLLLPVVGGPLCPAAAAAAGSGRGEVGGACCCCGVLLPAGQAAAATGCRPAVRPVVCV